MFQWFMVNATTGDLISLENENSSTYNISSVLYNDTGEYVCEASNSLGVLSDSTPAQLIGEDAEYNYM